MRVLFDQGAPAPLRASLAGHDVATAYELGWSQLADDALLEAAEERRFDVLVTTDQNLRYQQDLSQRQFAVVVLSTTSWPRIRKALPMVSDALEGMTPGAYLEVRIP